MPINTMTNDTTTREACDAYVANRKEAGRVIDIETCDISLCHTYFFDPYRIYPHNDDPPDNELMEQLGGRYAIEKYYFVCSDESGGWIVEVDLPPEKQQALYDRIAREQKRLERERNPRERERKLWEAARAAHPMYVVVTETHWPFEDEIEWKGDGEEPSWDALIEWFKVNHPAQASEVEREMAHHDLGDPLP